MIANRGEVLVRHYLLLFVFAGVSTEAAAQLLPELAHATQYLNAELVHRDDIRSRSAAKAEERWQEPWPAGFVHHWRDRRFGAGSVLRWTHVTACTQPASPEQAGPCPGTYSVALEFPNPPSKSSLDSPAIGDKASPKFCTSDATLIGAVRIAGNARDGSEDCLGVLTQGCVQFLGNGKLSLDLQFANASLSEPLKACADLPVQEQVQVSFEAG